MPASDYFQEVPLPTSPAQCSDSRCPCKDVKLTSGQGYLYISPEAVKYMQGCQTSMDLGAKMGQAVVTGNVELAMEMGTKKWKFQPILVCEQAAVARGLDLETAAADAKLWWKTGKVPRRTTPLAADKAKTASHDAVTSKQPDGPAAAARKPSSADAEALTRELAQAASTGDNEKVRQLLHAGADIEGRDSLGRTPLINAVAGSHRKTVELILNFGADPSATDETGFTPAEVAAMNEAAELVEVLKNHGGKADTKTLGDRMVNAVPDNFSVSDADGNVLREARKPDSSRGGKKRPWWKFW